MGVFYFYSTFKAWGGYWLAIKCTGNIL